MMESMLTHTKLWHVKASNLRYLAYSHQPHAELETPPFPDYRQYMPRNINENERFMVIQMLWTVQLYGDQITNEMQ